MVLPECLDFVAFCTKNCALGGLVCPQNRLLVEILTVLQILAKASISLSKGTLLVVYVTGGTQSEDTVLESFWGFARSGIWRCYG